MTTELTASVNFLPLDHPGSRAIARHIDRANKTPDNVTIDPSRSSDNVVDIWDQHDYMAIESRIYEPIIRRHNDYLRRRVAAGKIGKKKAEEQMWTYRKWVQTVPPKTGKVGDRPAETRLTRVATDWSIGSVETIERLYQSKGWAYHHEQVVSNRDGHGLGYTRPVLDNRKDQLEYYKIMHTVYTRAVKRLADTGAFHPTHGGLHVDEGGVPHYHCLMVPTGRTGRTGKLTESLNAALTTAATKLTGQPVSRGKATLRVLRQALDQSMIDDLSHLSGVDIQLERTQAGGGRSMAQHKAAKAAETVVDNEQLTKQHEQLTQQVSNARQNYQRYQQLLQDSEDEWTERQREYNENKKAIKQQEEELQATNEKLTAANNDLAKTLAASDKAHTDLTKVNDDLAKGKTALSNVKKSHQQLQQQYRQDYAVAHATSQQAAQAAGSWLVTHKSQPGFLATLSRWAQGQLTDQQLAQQLVQSAVSRLTQPQDDGPDL